MKLKHECTIIISIMLLILSVNDYLPAYADELNTTEQNIYEEVYVEEIVDNDMDEEENNITDFDILEAEDENLTENEMIKDETTVDEEEIIEENVNQNTEENILNDALKYSDEDIFNILVEENIEGRCTDDIFYSFDVDEHILKIYGNGSICDLYENVTDEPWVILYDEIEGFEISGEIKARLWQINKNSAKRSKHIGNIEETVKKMISEKREELEKASLKEE